MFYTVTTRMISALRRTEMSHFNASLIASVLAPTRGPGPAEWGPVFTTDDLSLSEEPCRGGG